MNCCKCSKEFGIWDKWTQGTFGSVYCMPCMNKERRDNPLTW